MSANGDEKEKEQYSSNYYYNYALQQQQIQQRLALMKEAQKRKREQENAVERAKQVAARQTAQQTPSMTGPLPPSLKVYTQRAFATCSGESERSLMQKKLYEILSRAIKSGSLHTTDWDRAALPELRSDLPRTSLIQEIPKKAAAVAAAEEEGPKRKKKKESHLKVPNLSAEEIAQRDLRAKRFFQSSQEKDTALSAKRRRNASFDLDAKTDSWSGATIRGRSEALEKDYFRLTAAPDPATVRPERVLSQALIELKKKWKNNLVDYDYMCSQLKAIRQDITVQAIKNKFTVNVYETHARIALENTDLNEYNQCQTQLKELYDFFSLEENTMKTDSCRNYYEFLAYRILYYLMLTFTATARDTAVSELRNILRDIPKEAWTHNLAVSHALQVRQAISLGDYASFFRLYASVPNMGQYILDTFVTKVRLQAAAKILKAYKFTMPLPSLLRLLGLSPDDLDQTDNDDNELSPIDFIQQIGFKLEYQPADNTTIVNLKASSLDPSGLDKQKTSLL